MLDQLVRNVGHGRIRNQQGPSGRRCAEWNHHANDEGPCPVTALADQLVSPLQYRMKEVHCLTFHTHQRAPTLTRVIGAFAWLTSRDVLAGAL